MFLESLLVLAAKWAAVQIDLIDVALCIDQDLEISQQALIFLDVQYISHHRNLLVKILYEALSVLNTRNKIAEPLHGMIKLSVAPNEQGARRRHTDLLSHNASLLKGGRFATFPVDRQPGQIGPVEAICKFGRYLQFIWLTQKQMLRFVVQLQMPRVQPCHLKLLELGIIAIARQ